MIEVFGKPLIAPEPPLDRAGRLRLAGWGGTAILAVFLAAVLIRADAGRSRAEASAQADAMANRQVLAAQQLVVRASEDELRRLSELQRVLSTDRDRLMARVNTLERDMTDLTGTVARQNVANPGETSRTVQVPAVSITPSVRDSAPPANVMVEIPSRDLPRIAAVPATTAVSEPKPVPAPVPPKPAANETTGTVVVATNAEVPTTSTAPVPAGGARLYGVDLGGAVSIAGVRALWKAVHDANRSSLDGLQPVFAAREQGKPSKVYFRLIAGPVDDALQAAKLCTALTVAVKTCLPTAYDGQRLTAPGGRS